MGSALLDALLGDGIAGESIQPEWLLDARRRAADELARDGLPGVRNEAWKYTNLRALEQRAYAHGDAQAATRVVDPAMFAFRASTDHGWCS